MRLLPRLLLAAPLLFAASGLRAGQIVVYGEKDFYVLELEPEIPQVRGNLTASPFTRPSKRMGTGRNLRRLWIS
jgi:hypothetical protein